MDNKQIEVSFAIPAGLLQEVVNYMSARPFAEVAGLLGKIMRLVEEQNKAASAAAVTPPTKEE